MRKPIDEMTPEEHRIERHYQENHFQYLVADIPAPKDTPKTWYGRWWRKWSEPVTILGKIIFGTILICAVVCGGVWVMLVCLTAL